MRVQASGQPLLLDVGTSEALPVSRPPATIAADRVEESDTLTIHVEQKQGWIEIIVPDAHPGSVLRSVRADDGSGGGRDVPVSLAWRSGGQLHLLDDPTTSYTLTFEPEQQQAGGASWVVVGGSLVVLALASTVLVVALRARRR